jgi:hypothetical protein
MQVRDTLKLAIFMSSAIADKRGDPKVYLEQKPSKTNQGGQPLLNGLHSMWSTKPVAHTNQPLSLPSSDAAKPGRFARHNAPARGLLA